MPRTRMLKPEMFSSEQIAAAGELALIQLQGLWIEGDDNGIYPAQPFALCRRTIALFGHKPEETRKRIDRLREACDSGRSNEPLVYEYEVDGVSYWLVPGFCRQNPNQRKPSLRYPTPRLTADSPEWLKNWIRENTSEKIFLPPESTGKVQGFPGSFPPEAEAEAGPGPDTDPGPDSSNRPKPEQPARATPSSLSPGGREKTKQPGKKARAPTEADRILELVTAYLNASAAKIRDMLGNDDALNLTVRALGGWTAMSEKLHTGGAKAQNQFRVAFGQACCELRGKRPEAQAGDQGTAQA
jgi:hypothetical protein